MEYTISIRVEITVVLVDPSHIDNVGNQNYKINKIGIVRYSLTIRVLIMFFTVLKIVNIQMICSMFMIEICMLSKWVYIAKFRVRYELWEYEVWEFVNKTQTNHDSWKIL